VTDFRFHGLSMQFTPLMALVESAASSWGIAQVYRFLYTVSKTRKSL